MSDYPPVSVVISTWNRVELLEQAIESVVKQDYQGTIELIVVDNASDDGTKEFMQELKSKSDIHDSDCKFSNVEYIRLSMPDSSAMRTLNTGFDLSGGKYILVLDDDAIMNEPECLRVLVTYMESMNSKIALICPNVISQSGHTQLLEYRDVPIQSWEEGSKRIGRMYAYCGACALMRADVFRDIGFYDESFVLYWNEADINVKFRYMGLDTVYTNEVSATHFVSQKQRFMKKSLYYHLRNGNMVMNRTLIFWNRLYLVPLRVINLLYVIHTEFKFDPLYIIKVYGVALHSLINIFYMTTRYKCESPSIIQEVNEVYMRVNVAENEKWGLRPLLKHVWDWLYYRVVK